MKFDPARTPTLVFISAVGAIAILLSAYAGIQYLSQGDIYRNSCQLKGTSRAVEGYPTYQRQTGPRDPKVDGFGGVAAVFTVRAYSTDKVFFLDTPTFTALTDVQTGSVVSGSLQPSKFELTGYVRQWGGLCVMYVDTVRTSLPD